MWLRNVPQLLTWEHRPFLSAAAAGAANAASGPQWTALVALLLGASRSIWWSDRRFGAWLHVSRCPTPSNSVYGFRAVSFQRYYWRIYDIVAPARCDRTPSRWSIARRMWRLKAGIQPLRRLLKLGFSFAVCWRIVALVDYYYYYYYYYYYIKPRLKWHLHTSQLLQGAIQKHIHR